MFNVMNAMLSKPAEWAYHVLIKSQYDVVNHAFMVIGKIIGLKYFAKNKELISLAAQSIKWPTSLEIWHSNY